MKMLMLSHAFDNRVALKYVVSMLLNNNKLFSNSSLVSYDEEIKKSTGSDFCKLLRNQIELLQYLDEKEFKYFCCWLKVLEKDLKELFSKEVIQVLEETVLEVDVSFKDIVEYHNLPMIIQNDLSGLPLNDKVLEAINNAAKYCKSWVRAEVVDGYLVITNDCNTRTSGTQQGLKLHQYDFSISEGIATAKIKMSRIPISYSLVQDLAREVGWSKDVNINGINNIHEDASEAYKKLFSITNRVCYVPFVIFTECCEFIKEALAKCVDSEKQFLISENTHFPGVYITYDLWNTINPLDDPRYEHWFHLNQ